MYDLAVDGYTGSIWSALGSRVRSMSTMRELHSEPDDGVALLRQLIAEQRSSGLPPEVGLVGAHDDEESEDFVHRIGTAVTRDVEPQAGDPLLVRGAFAEYASLRAEAVARIGAQLTLVGLALTAAAALSAVALESGKPDRMRLLLIVPLVVNGLGLYYVQHNVVRSRIASYVRDGLVPVMYGKRTARGYGGYWDDRKGELGNFFSLVVIASNFSIFACIDAFALILVRAAAFSGGAVTTMIWFVGGVLSLCLIAAAVVSARSYGVGVPESEATDRS